LFRSFFILKLLFHVLYKRHSKLEYKLHLCRYNKSIKNRYQRHIKGK